MSPTPPHKQTILGPDQGLRHCRHHTEFGSAIPQAQLNCSSGPRKKPASLDLDHQPGIFVFPTSDFALPRWDPGQLHHSGSWGSWKPSQAPPAHPSWLSTCKQTVYPNLPGSTGSSNRLDRGPGGVEWPGQGPPPFCVGKAGPTSMQTNDLPQLLLGRSAGKKSCATRKPRHRLSRDGSPREPPLPRE